MDPVFFNSPIMGMNFFDVNDRSLVGQAFI